MDNKNNDNNYMNDNDMDDMPCCMNRRGFMKIIGAGAAGAALASIGGCKSERDSGRIVPTDKMTYRVDPHTGNRISLLGFGMMRLPRIPRRRGESLPDSNDLDQESVNELVDYAIAHGVNFFDTAPPYCKGFSEKATGEALSRHPRNKYYVSTKLSNHRLPPAGNREGSINMYRKSFEDLQVDYIDYYLLHSVGNLKAFKERFIDNGILDFLIKEREAGRIRNLGWSFHGDFDFFEYMMSGKYPWGHVMVLGNYLDWDNVVGRANIISRRQHEILEKKNIPAVVMSPLMGGGLSSPHYRAREQMVQADSDASASSWGLRFIGSQPSVLTVLSGMTFMDHLQDNICTYSPLTPIAANEQAMLDGVTDIMLQYRNILCTRCQYCMPCPYGIDIPEILMHYNRCMNEGNFPVDNQSENFKKARRAFLVSMDRSVDTLRQANRCINCGQCVPTCPQRINIPQEMRRIDKLVEELKIGV